MADTPLGFASQAEGGAAPVPGGGFASQVAAPVAAAPVGPAPTGKTVNVISPTDGKVYGLDESYLAQAKAQGYEIETPEHAGIRSWVESKKGITGAAAVAAKALLNEATFGFSDPIVEKMWDPYQNARFKALENEYQGAHYAGAGAGFIASMLYGGELFGAASKIGGAARAGVLGGVAEKALAKGITSEAAYRIGAEGAEALAPHAPSIARQILAHAADYGAQGLVLSSPKAAAQLLAGDPDKAAETWIWGAAGGAALGGVAGLAKGVYGRLAGGVAAKALPAAEGAIVPAAEGAAEPTLRERLAGKLREIGDEQATSSLDLSKNAAKKLRRAKAFGDANKIVRDENLAEFAGDFEGMANRISELHDDAGRAIGELRKVGGDKAVASYDEVYNAILKPAVDAQKSMGKVGAGKNVEKWLHDEVLRPLNDAWIDSHGAGMTPKSGPSLMELHDVRKVIDGATRYDATVDNATNALRKEVRAVVNEYIDKKMAESGEELGKELLPAWKQANRRYQVLSTLKENALNNIERGAANRKHSLTDYLGNQIGATVGGFIGGGVGSLVGGYVGGEANNALRRVAPAYLSKAAYAASDAVAGKGLAELESAFARHDTQLSLVPSVIDRMAGGSKPVRDTMGVNILTRFLEAHDAKLDDNKGLMSFADNLASLSANPERMQAKIEEAIAPLEGDAPGVATAVAAKLPQVAQYLSSQAPKSPYAVPTPFTPPMAWKPTDAQMKDYRTKVAVALDPYKALDALADNTLTKAHVDALQAVAPKLYQEMLKRIADYGGTGKAPALPYAQRLKLSLMTGAPLDRSLAQLGSLQSIFQSKDAGKVEGGGKMKPPAAEAGDIARITG